MEQGGHWEEEAHSFNKWGVWAPALEASNQGPTLGLAPSSLGSGGKGAQSPSLGCRCCRRHHRYLLERNLVTECCLKREQIPPSAEQGLSCSCLLHTQADSLPGVLQGFLGWRQVKAKRLTDSSKRYLLGLERWCSD